MEKLHKVEVPFVSTDDCNASYNGNGYSITDGMICAGEKGKDSCQGDSGGPMVASVNGTNVLVVRPVDAMMRPAPTCPLCCCRQGRAPSDLGK